MNAHQTMILKASAYRLTKEHIGKALKPFGLTMLQWVTLGLVHDAGSQGVSPTQLARELHVSQAYVSGLLTHLHAKQLIENKTNNKDARSHTVAVTSHGKDMVIKAERKVREQLKNWLAPISKEDIAVYMKVLEEISHL